MDYARICINCMHEKQNAQEICPNCGFNPATYKWPSYALEPYTILDGKYLIGRVLGAGGFGITYIAYDMMLECTRAIKEFFLQGSMYRMSSESTGVSVVNGSFPQEQMFKVNREKFMQEARLLAKIDHLPGIVGVYDFFNENDTSYMVLEYLEGMTLKDYVKSRGGRVNYQEVLEKIHPVIKSLQLLHERRIYHRDISPDNIMVMRDGSLKLFDFGGARIQNANNDNRSIMVMKKTGYTPVEQYVDGEQGPWTDEYAMAATIYYCICGVIPPESVTRTVGEDPLKKPTALVPGIPAEQEKAIMKGLGLRKEDRYPDMVTFEEALYKNGSQPKPVLNRWKLIIPLSLLIISAACVGVAYMSGLIGKRTEESTDSVPQETEKVYISEKETDNSEETEQVITEMDTVQSSDEETESLVDMESETETIAESEEVPETEKEMAVVKENAIVQEGYYIFATRMNEERVIHAKPDSSDFLLELQTDSEDNIEHEFFYVKREENDTYSIRLFGTDLYLDCGMGERGKPIIVTEEKAENCQRWCFDLTGEGTYLIRNASHFSEDLYLDCEMERDDVGTPINSYKLNGNENQRWYLFFNGCIHQSDLEENVSFRPGRYTIASLSNSTNYLTVPKDNNLLTISGSPMMFNLWKEEENIYIGVSGDKTNSFCRTGDGKITIQSSDNENRLTWTLKSEDGGSFSIHSMSYDQDLCLDWHMMSDGIIGMDRYNGGENQCWILMPNGWSPMTLMKHELEDEEPKDILILSVQGRQDKALRFVPGDTIRGHYDIMQKEGEGVAYFSVYLLSDSNSEQKDYFVIGVSEEHPDWVLTAQKEANSDVPALTAAPYQGLEGQKWFLEEDGEAMNAVYIIPSIQSMNEVCLDCFGYKSDDGTVVQLSNKKVNEAHDNQLWKLVD